MNIEMIREFEETATEIKLLLVSISEMVDDFQHMGIDFLEAVPDSFKYRESELRGQSSILGEGFNFYSQ